LSNLNILKISQILKIYQTLKEKMSFVINANLETF